MQGQKFFAVELDQAAESLLFAGVPPKVLDVHVLVNSQEDLNLKTEYDVPAGVIRFRDFEEALGIKVLKYALSTSDNAPGTEDYKVAVGTKALPSNTTSLWLKAKREGATTYYTWCCACACMRCKDTLHFSCACACTRCHKHFLSCIVYLLNRCVWLSR